MSCTSPQAEAAGVGATDSRRAGRSEGEGLTADSEHDVWTAVLSAIDRAAGGSGYNLADVYSHSNRT